MLIYLEADSIYTFSPRTFLLLGLMSQSQSLFLRSLPCGSHRGPGVLFKSSSDPLLEVKWTPKIGTAFWLTGRVSKLAERNEQEGNLN